jgi:hypothetical protein
MAEFLVHQALPLGLVSEIGVTDTHVQAYVAELAASMGRDVGIAIRQSWYF